MLYFGMNTAAPVLPFIGSLDASVYICVVSSYLVIYCVIC